jgi:formylmethanofuran dehydrogenase subunit E
MDSIRDQHLDPPVTPERAKCAGCGEVFNYDDMTTINWKDYCVGCLDWMRAEKEAELEDMREAE